MSREAIIEAMANLFWWDAWASHVEEHDCENLSGCQIENHAPPRPDGILEHATEVAAKIEQASGAKLDALYERAVLHQASEVARSNGHSWWVIPAEERFGECLAYKYMGAGVSWSDDHPDAPGLVVPYGESLFALDFWACERGASCPDCGAMANETGACSVPCGE